VKDGEMNSRTVLVVERGDTIRRGVARALPEECELRTADSVSAAAAALASEAPDLIVVDASLTTGADGPESPSVLELVRGSAVQPKVIVVSESLDRRAAVEAIGLGAFDYCVRPLDTGELSVLLRRALRIHALEMEAEGIGERGARSGRFGALVGTCDRMKGVFSAVGRVASTDVCVLLVGESGTGKKLLARAIHELGPRRSGPFVVCNSALSRPGRSEEELFGPEERGPEAGAVRTTGRIAQADGGSLLLDGICGFPLKVQARLAAFLRDKEDGRNVGPAGAGPDVRVMATADHAPDCGDAKGAMWNELYYRLGVITVEVPPLRERGEDILILSRDLLDRLAGEHGRAISGFSRSAVAAMMSHAWPGNIPELETRVRRAVVMSRGRLVSSGDLGLNGEDRPAERTLGEAKSDLERSMVTDALKQAAGNVSRAARSIGVSRPTMYDLIRKYGLDVSEFKQVGTV
jgi:two-component system NtrC family response regulator